MHHVLSESIELYRPFLGEATEGLLRKAGVGEKGDSPAKACFSRARLLSRLATELAEAHPKRHALSLFFLLSGAECIAKTVCEREPRLSSSDYACGFFLELVPSAHRTALEQSFFRKDGAQASLVSGLRALYQVRNALAHDGVYWSFRYGESGEAAIGKDESVVSRVRLSHLTTALLAGGAAVAAHLVSDPSFRHRLRLRGRHER